MENPGEVCLVVAVPLAFILLPFVGSPGARRKTLGDHCCRGNLLMYAAFVVMSCFPTIGDKYSPKTVEFWIGVIILIVCAGFFSMCSTREDDKEFRSTAIWSSVILVIMSWGVVLAVLISKNQVVES